MAVSELLILGVDAADFSILSSDSASLPTLERLMQEGVSAPLESTTPPITGAAWPAMACGRDPNSIGMFDFRNFSREDCGEYRPSPSAVDPFWSYLSEEGYTAGISGYPIAPLDKPVDGFVLSWPWYLPADEQRLAPAEFFEDTDIEVDDYIRENTEFEVEQVLTDLWDKAEFDERVLNRFDFDVYFTHLDADTIIHIADEDTLDDVYRVYEAIDEIVASILEHCADDCAVMMVSDHGISKVHGKFYMTQFLIDQGLLQRETTAAERVTQTDISQRAIELAKTTLNALGLTRPIQKLLLSDDKIRQQAGLEHGLDFEDIDCENTVVVNSGDWGQLYGTDGDDEVKAVVDSLSRMAAEQGFKVVVDWPETAYEGDQLHPDAPDAIVTIRAQDGILRPKSVVSPGKEDPEDYFETFDTANLNHGEDGVFVLSGPNVKHNTEVEPLHLLDVAPTILNQLVGVVPPDVHGTARTDLYEPGSRPASTPETGFKDFQQTLIEDRSEHGEMDEVKEKLAELGYFE